jgi:hypothetical protein
MFVLKSSYKIFFYLNGFKCSPWCFLTNVRLGDWFILTIPCRQTKLSYLPGYLSISPQELNPPCLASMSKSCLAGCRVKCAIWTCLIHCLPAYSFGWWLMAGADLFWEKKYCWLVCGQVDSLQATSVTISVEYNGAACIWNIVVMWCLLVLFRPVTEIAREVVFLRTPYRWYCWNVQY